MSCARGSTRKGRAYQIVNAAGQLAELRRFTADRRIAAEELKETDRAQRQLARDTDFVTAVRDGAREVEAMLTEAQQRVEEGIRRG